MASSGKVRVFARVRGPLTNGISGADAGDSVPVSKPWIVVTRPDPETCRRVKVSFDSDQSSTSGKQQCYEVDECYEQHVGNQDIFAGEIKPLISGLFEGQNCTVFAYGPRGSGKTYTLQGSVEDPGLLVCAMDSILLQAQEEGKVVSVSVFEVYQDRIMDIVDLKRPDVSVLEDGQGKITLKGLSKVKINSLAEFERVYANATNNCEKTASKSNIGCIIHLVSPKIESSSAQLVGKMIFVDLASHEDSRRKSIDGSELTEATKIKKSLLAVHNVLYALNSKERCVPYRESKLTRMLQDSLSGKSRILMVTCMNPSFCQDTLQTISLASRSCIASFLAHLDLGRNVNKSVIGTSSPHVQKSPSKSHTRTVKVSSPQIAKSASHTSTTRKTHLMSSPLVPKSASKYSTRMDLMSPKSMKPVSSSASTRKQAGSLLRKPNGGVVVGAKGRELFVGTNQSKNTKLENRCSVSTSTMAPSALEVNASVGSELNVKYSTEQEERTASSDMDQLRSEKDMSVRDVSSDISSELPFEKDAIQSEKKNVIDLSIEDKENKSNNELSPPLSARLREISDSLKALCITTETTNMEKSKEDNSSITKPAVHEVLEPKTPIYHANPCDRSEMSNASPWENFQLRSSGMKNSLVQEYLNFLNTASMEELKALKGIGEKRATYILELREESPQPFKELDDLKEIGLSVKQIKGMLRSVAGNLFT